ncbi:CPBP family intramembrane metalloprotease [Pedobacter sp. PAMC26386]|nr:CPBP family intramembrane metalloprotease [Pedobacter sp. PAMC26386]
MNSIYNEPEENGAYIQLVILLGFTMLGLLIGSVLSLAIMLGVYGTDGLGNAAMLTSGDAVSTAILRISQALTTGFMFIFPPLLLAWTQKTKVSNFYGFRKPKASLLFLVFLIMLCSMPLMEWIGLANQKMILPEFLKPIENWMRDKETEAMKMTILLLKTKDLFDFLINISVIALLPAIGEELLFRGGIQRIFTRMFKNPHLAIWTCAFIFSAIHLQFFGFLPRLFLGAAFGYIYLWTGSLWYAMLAHFLNNAYAVGVAWYLQEHNIPLTEADNSSNFPWYGYIISLILSIILFKYLKNKTTATMENNWVKVYTTENPVTAEIIKQGLIEHDIAAVIMNKKDSSYQSFGIIEVLVNKKDFDTADAYIKSTETE